MNGLFSTWRIATLGALTFGLAIWAWHLTRWHYNTGKGRWTNVNSLKTLVFPFVPLWLYGNLMMLCANGLLGWVAGASLWAGDMTGRTALVTGTGSAAPNITRSTGLTLSPEGSMVLLVLTAIAVATVVHKKGATKSTLILPIMAGTCMALTAGIAGTIGRAIGPAVDTVGAMLVHAV